MQRVFIVGCPRSGTTLVQSIITAHSKVTSFTESHFFYKGFRGWGSGPYFVRERLHDLLDEFIEDNVPSAGLPVPEIKRSDPSATALSIVNFLDDCASLRGAATWIEKTPNHVFRIPLIERAAPDAMFIHVVRRPEGVVPSLYAASHAWGRAKTWAECAVHWALALRTTLGRLDDPRHIVVPYEWLVERPEEEAMRIFRWLGLPWEANVVSDYASSARLVVRSKENWKTANFQRIENKNVMKLSDLPLSASIIVRCFDAYTSIIETLAEDKKYRAA